MEIFVSADGVNYYDITASEASGVNIPGDEDHDDQSYARSYDLAAAGLGEARFVRIDGVGDGPGGAGTDFDLDAIGAVHYGPPGGIIGDVNCNG